MKNDAINSLATVITRALMGGSVVVALGAVTIVDAAASQKDADDSVTARAMVSNIQKNFDLRNTEIPAGLSPDATRAFESKERSHFIYANGCAY
jgi:hypothetical protein